MSAIPKRAEYESAWLCLGHVRTQTGTAVVWANPDTGVQVLSSVDTAEQNPPGSGLVVPHFHVSAIHRSGPLGATRRACTDQELELVRAAFGMGGSEEDNHGPGIARHLWIVVGRDREPACPCKADEDRTVEGPRVRYETKDERP